MTPDELSRLAYSGTPPDSAMPYEWLLWYRLRDIYDKVKRHEMTKADGAAQKQTAVNSYQAEMEQHERCVKLWQRIEQAGTAYAKDKTIENADRFYKAVYGVPAGKDVNTRPDGEQNDTEPSVLSERMQKSLFVEGVDE